MNTSFWLWTALIAFLVFCCIPVFFMGGHRRRTRDARGEENNDLREL